MTASLRATATNLDLIVKTDRKELARRAEAIPTLPDAPPTDTDELLAWVAVAFAEVLDLPWVGPQANFFGLGGDSITAARVVAKVRQRFGAALSLRAFLADPTEIGRGLTGVASIRFIVPRSAHVHAVLPLLEHYRSVSMLDRVQATGKLPERVDGIVTFSERMVPATARLAGQLGLGYHGVDVAAGLTDKSQQRKLLAQARVEQLRHQTAENVTELESALAAVSYPAVVKPTRSEASLNTYLIQDASQAACVIRRLRHRWPENTMEGGPAVLITEEYLTGAPTEHGIADYVSVESLAVDRHRLHMAIFGTFPQASAFRETGIFWPAAIDVAVSALLSENTTSTENSTGS